MRLKVDVQYVSVCSHLPQKAAIVTWAKASLVERQEKRIELGVRIVDEAESAELNQRYRRKRGPTNVLSFSGDCAAHLSACFLGDLVICAPIIKQEAIDQNKAEMAHWAHMVVHGIMHLCGYDHMNNYDATIMEAKEVQILERLGFDDPYSAD